MNVWQLIGNSGIIGTLVMTLMLPANATPLVEESQEEETVLAETTHELEVLSQAEDEIETEEEETLRIVVTAEKRPEAVQDIPSVLRSLNVKIFKMRESMTLKMQPAVPQTFLSLMVLTVVLSSFIVFVV